MSPRWKSALAPAIAITALVSAPSAHAQNQHDMTFHTIPPCTVVDTRLAGGAFNAGEIRAYNVVGSSSFTGQGGSATGCGVPGFSNGTAQVQAVALNITALTPAGNGNIAANAADQALGGSVVNFMAGQNVANTAPVAVAQTTGVNDFKLQVNVSSSHVLVRVFGYYSKPVQTVHVHPVPGDPTASGTALRNALNGITDASAAKRYVLKIEPGIYDLGTNPLVMKSYVDLDGSGQEATVLRGMYEGSEAMFFGLITTASSTELRDLQVDCNGSEHCVLAPRGTESWIHHVTVSGNDGAFHKAITVVGASSRIEDVTIRFQGGYDYGILISEGPGNIRIARTRIESKDAIGAWGINMWPSASGTSVEIRDVQIEITGESSPQYRGIQLDASTATVTGTSINVAGGTTSVGLGLGLHQGEVQVTNSQIRVSAPSGIGIWNFGTLTVEGSQIAASFRTILSTTGVQGPQIAASRLEGGPVIGGSPVCSFVWDETFTSFAGPACP